MMKLGGCKKGWWIFRFHDWEYLYDLKVYKPGDLTYNIRMSYIGHNLGRTNERFVCSKCGAVELARSGAET